MALHTEHAVNSGDPCAWVLSDEREGAEHQRD